MCPNPRWMRLMLVGRFLVFLLSFNNLPRFQSLLLRQLPSSSVMFLHPLWGSYGERLLIPSAMLQFNPPCNEKSFRNGGLRPKKSPPAAKSHVFRRGSPCRSIKTANSTLPMRRAPPLSGRLHGAPSSTTTTASVGADRKMSHL